MFFTDSNNSWIVTPKTANEWRQQTIIRWQLNSTNQGSDSSVGGLSCYLSVQSIIFRPPPRTFAREAKRDCRYTKHSLMQLFVLQTTKTQDGDFWRARSSTGKVKHGTRFYAVYNQESSRQRRIWQRAKAFESAKQDKRFISKRETSKSRPTSLRAAAFERKSKHRDLVGGKRLVETK